MTRIACARMRDAPLSSLVRLEPTLRDECIAVVNTIGSHGRIVACTPTARALGVMLGQTAHQAKALAPELRIRVMDAGAMAAARSALFDAAASLAPRIEPHSDRIYIDVADLSGLYGSEAGFVAALTEAARRVGLEIDVGVASSKGIARIAAMRESIVVDGYEREFLAELPLKIVSMTISLRAEFVRLGIRTLGDLAALPMEATATRLGSDAARIIALARGQDPTPLFPKPPSMRFEEAMELDWEVSDVSALVFVLKRLADALIARLACRSLAASGVTLTLSLLSRDKDERTLSIANPTRDVVTLVHLARASLEARPPPDSVVAVRMTALATAPRSTQLGLFDPPMPPPEKLTLTLAKLTALVGDGRIGTPRVPDSHRPQSVALGEFEHSLARARTQVVAREVRVALHVFRPARVAEVTSERGRLLRVYAREIKGTVRVCVGPFRVDGEWWGEHFDHDGYDIELSDGGLYLLGFDRIANTWRIEGVYE